MLALAPRLTDRDRALLDLLWDLRVLTSAQVATMLFDSPITARHRLATLVDLGLLHPFRPQRSDGTLDLAHYLLDHLGSYVVAAGRGADPETLDWRNERMLAIETSQRLAHTVGVNGVLADLYRHVRRTPGAELRWLTEGQFTRWWEQNTVHRTELPNPRPDAYGVWTDRDGWAVPFAVEYDRGTEHLDRLAGKLPGYTELAWVCARPVWVLFAFVHPRREANARDALGYPEIPVATATLDGRHGAHEAIWRPLRQDERKRIPHLAHADLSARVSDFAFRISRPQHRGQRDPRSLSRAEWDRTGRAPDPALPGHPPLVTHAGPLHRPIPASKIRDNRPEPVISRNTYEPIDTSEDEDDDGRSEW